MGFEWFFVFQVSHSFSRNARLLFGDWLFMGNEWIAVFPLTLDLKTDSSDYWILLSQ
jgi:hypothetical protein